VNPPLPESLLAAIIGISADAIICVDGEQRIISFNEGASRIFGYPASEVLGQPLDMLLPARSRVGHRQRVEQFVNSDVAARRIGERRELAGLRKDGEEFSAEAAIAHLTVDGQRYASVVLRDITERKRTEYRQQLLADASEQLGASIDLGRTLELVASVWLPLFGGFAVVEMSDEGGLHHAGAGPDDTRPDTIVHAMYTPHEQMVSVNDSPLGEQPPVAMAPVDQVLDAIPERYRAEAMACSPQSAVVIALIHRGEVFGRVVVLTDRVIQLDASDLSLATEMARRASIALDHARLHAQLRHALHARDETMSIVSHDLRNPASAVKMLTEMILVAERQPPLPAEVREQVSVMRSAAEQMESLIQNLLDASRAEAGHLVVRPRMVSASTLLRDALRTMAPLAADKRISITTDWTDPLPDVHVEPERITQVVSNIAGNAIKFTPAGGCIHITAAVQPGHLLISITDTGPGIATEDLPHVFDRYWQSDHRNRGLGLGLPIARAIIEAHHGRLWAEHVDGRGAIFHFTLPT
jgi:PAS domain S-box-containing protein